jgi:DNA repair protein RadC
MEPERSPYVTRFRLQTFRVEESGGSPFARRKACSSEDVFRIIPAMRQELGLDDSKEHFWVLCMNNKNRLNGYKHVSTGTLTASLVHPREVLIAALELHAAAIILSHNHPSGDPAPSPEDIDITRRIKECCDVMGLRLLDHVVTGYERYFSFNDRGML